MKNIVGKRVKQARLRSKPRITQADLAARLQMMGWEIDRAGVAKIEIGLRQVTDVEVDKLAKALKVSITWLFGDQNQK